MTDTIELLEIEYKAEFQKPAFQLGRVGSDVIQIFYETLAPMYKIPLGEIRSPQMNSMEDLGFEITLFGGSGILSLNAKEFRLRFNGIRTQADLEIVERCSVLADGALLAAIDGVAFNVCQFTVASWISLKHGSDQVDAIFSNAARFPLFEKLYKKGRIFHPSLQFSFMEDKSSFGHNVTVERSTRNIGNLFLSTNSYLYDALANRSLQEKIQDVQDAINEIRSALGLDCNPTVR